MTEQDTSKMTHDEMIDVLKGLVFGTFDRTTAKEREALDMAISALSGGEYIKKSDLLQQVTTEELSDFKDCDVIHAEVIDELTTYSFPDSAENKGEPKTGHWISHREHCENLRVMPSGLGAYEWCSNCDCGIDVREWHRNNYNFCPNCGADMRGKAE